jgi:hypothetical protein
LIICLGDTFLVECWLLHQLTLMSAPAAALLLCHQFSLKQPAWQLPPATHTQSAEAAAVEHSSFVKVFLINCFVTFLQQKSVAALPEVSPGSCADPVPPAFLEAASLAAATCNQIQSAEGKMI